MNIKTYIERRDILSNTRFLITSSGEGYFLEDGEKFTRKEFAKRYPLPISFVFHNSANADGSKSYLGTD